MKTYKLLYKVAYRYSRMWKYVRFTVNASSLAAAKAKVKKSHPKATTLLYVEKL